MKKRLVARHHGAVAMLPDDAPVELVHWPREDERRRTFTRRGVPCLLLVAAGAEIPAALGLNEDWVRLPADERDVAARAQNLSRRSARIAAAPPLRHAPFRVAEESELVVLPDATCWWSHTST